MLYLWCTTAGGALHHMRNHCLPLLVSAPETILHDDLGPPALLTRCRHWPSGKVLEGQPPRTACVSPAHRLSSQPAPRHTAGWCIARNPQPVRTGGAHPPAFANAVPPPAWERLQTPISLIFLMLVPGTGGAWHPWKPATWSV